MNFTPVPGDPNLISERDSCVSRLTAFPLGTQYSDIKDVSGYVFIGSLQNLHGKRLVLIRHEHEDYPPTLFPNDGVECYVIEPAGMLGEPRLLSDQYARTRQLTEYGFTDSRATRPLRVVGQS